MFPSSSSTSHERGRSRYRYQMLPSKDNGSVSVARESERDESGEQQRNFNGLAMEGEAAKSWKEQARQDLKPSRHRDT
jgi:hypothetical protein